jgi:hypothetical protein
MSHITLISCVAKKLDRPAAARELYTSQLFKGCRAWADKHAQQWFILSAEHGLVNPGQMVAPYDTTLTKMNRAARQAWAQRVMGQLVPRLHGVDEVTILAGEDYREFIVPKLQALGIKVNVPMRGLFIGQQYAWLKANT